MSQNIVEQSWPRFLFISDPRDARAAWASTTLYPRSKAAALRIGVTHHCYWFQTRCRFYTVFKYNKIFCEVFLPTPGTLLKISACSWNTARRTSSGVSVDNTDKSGTTGQAPWTAEQQLNSRDLPSYRNRIKLTRPLPDDLTVYAGSMLRRGV